MSNRKIGLREKLKAGISFNVPYKCRHLYVWGIGNTALLYQEGLKRLQAEGIEFEGYIDSRCNTGGGGTFAQSLSNHQIFC